MLRSIQELDLTPKGEVFPSPADWRDRFIYFLLVDRFDNNLHSPAYDGSRGTNERDPLVGSRAQGGNLRGIMRRLSYLQGLGVSALWLSPVLKNPQIADAPFHGYAIQNFLKIDPRLGTREDLKELVQMAHTMGIAVILDIVINHTADVWYYEGEKNPLYRHDGTQYAFGGWRARHAPEEFEDDDAVWPAELQNPDAYKRRGSIVNWNDPEELVNADFINLKALNLNDPAVLSTLQQVYKYWIAECDIDGYRVDTVKHVEPAAAVAFFNSIQEYAASIGKTNFFLFGEIVGDDGLISRYVGRQPSQDDAMQALDAALDFPLYFVLEEVIKGFASPQLLRERLARIHQTYPNEDASESFVTFLDNHDQMARPYRRFLHNVSDQQQAVLGIGYLLTSVGIPVIYYGTEQGFDGGGPSGPYQDAHIRECMFGGAWGAFGTQGMHFFNTEHPLYKTIAKIASARAEEPALRYGRMYFREISENGEQFVYPTLGFGMLAFSRILDTNEVLVVLNLRDTPYTNYCTLDSALTPAGELLQNMLAPSQEALVESRAGRACIEVTLPAHTMAIFQRKPTA